ncbi:hypothetical protein KBY91_11195 [Streptomyces sp. RK23]|nr:hypothetical protein [Streptomyces sp. RK74B]MBQ1003976.1 hypothetical protein [Streptomyces sp. RK23]BET46035.1 hypothetical protein RGQ21_10170 [Kitasatospora aureofaciens]
MAPRRPVPSPAPKGRRGDGHRPRRAERRRLVVCAGGGGVPVTADHDTGVLTGVEAVVDKDFTAASLLILTDVPNVSADFGTPRQQPVLDEPSGNFGTGPSPERLMQPKTEAAARFVEWTGGLGAIGALDAAYAIVQGTSATFVRPELPVG